MTALLVLAMGGCVVPAEDTCEAAAERLGVVPCVHDVPDPATWELIARPADAIDQETTTKWAAPYGEGSPLPDTLFLNANAYPLHWQMLAAAFPERFPGLTLESYSVMVLDPRLKSLESGNIAQYDGPDGRFVGFTIWDDRTRPELTVSYDQVLAAWLDLNARFAPEILVFVPNTQAQADAVASWTDAPFEVRALAP